MIPQVRQYAYYSYYGFSYIQNWVANTVLRHVTEEPEARIWAMTLPMTSQPIIADAFTYILYLILPYFIMLMFIPMVYRVTYRIVKEKELKTKEIMRMMGMKMAPYWMSWFVYFTIVNLFLSTVAWMFMFLPSAVYRNGEFHSYNKVIKYTDGFVLWLVIWMYG
jgi:hypothetical protein